MKRWLAPLLVVGILAACEDAPRNRSNDDDDGGIGGGVAGSGPVGGGDPVSSGGGMGGLDGVGGSVAATGGGGQGPDVGIAPGDLVISEIMNNPAAVTDDHGEWLEIYNASDHPLDLQGLVIRHEPEMTTPTLSILEAVVIAPGAYAVLARNGDAALNGGIVADYVYGTDINLNNTDDYLALETVDGLVIDETSWNEISGLDPDGKSRSLDGTAMSAAMNDDDTFFCEATTEVPGSIDLATPGAPNPSCF